MAGDDSYHAYCFKCKVCKNRIDELVFAKTSQGIYCMSCHSERMIKIRKHTQKKAEREKANGGSGSSKSRERDGKNHHRENGGSSPGHDRIKFNGLQTPSPFPTPSRHPDASRTPSKPRNPTYVSDAFDPVNPPRIHTPSAQQGTSLTSPSLPSNPVSVNVMAPSDSDRRIQSGAFSRPELDVGNPVKQSTLPIPQTSSEVDPRRRSSYDDGVRPLNILFKQSPPSNSNLAPERSLSHSSSSDTLTVTSRRDKRRSINPGLTLSPFPDTTIPSSTLSPRSESFSNQQTIAHSPTSPRLNTFDIALRKESIDLRRHDRPNSHSSSIHSSRSLSTSTEEGYNPRSPSPSIHTFDYDQNPDDTIVIKSPTDVHFEASTPNPGGPQGDRISASLSPSDLNGSRYQRHTSYTPSVGVDKRRSRSPSPAHRADVPHSVESGTDTEPEGEQISGSGRDTLPPLPPPKDASGPSVEQVGLTQADADGSYLDIDELTGSSPVEHTSHATYIAPALPPIRFSMNTADFSELLNSVGGLPPLKSLDNLARLTKKPTSNIPSTPPPSAALTSTTTFTPSNGSTGFPRDSAPNNMDDVLQAPSIRESSPSEWDTPNTDSATLQTSTSLMARQSSTDMIFQRLRETVEDAKSREIQQLKLERVFVEAIVEALESRGAEHAQMKARFDGMKRTSRQYIEGLTVAQTEYDRELKARRDAEAEVTRLRVLLSGQAARLTALSGDSRRQEVRQQISKELNDSLSGLEQNLSRLKVERDVTLAEVEELSATKSSNNASPDVGTVALGRSLTKRLDNIRNQYQKDLIPLTQQRETLTREIAELKAVRDVFLEETSVLNARNEELAQLSAVYTRRMDTVHESPLKDDDNSNRASFDKSRGQFQSTTPLAPSLSSSTSGSSTVYDETIDPRFFRAPKTDVDLHTPAKGKFMKWPGSKVKDVVSPSPGTETSKGKAHLEHNFQQLSVLRFTRCDHCGDKMWGSQLRCTICSTSIHVRCIANVHIPCTQQLHNIREEPQHIPPSMFGRDLVEQVRADSKDEDRQIPVIVEKCIDAVEAIALDYEGIYRKTGGSGQSKAITQLFERGDYSSFNLRDTDRFNDICSVTSVLKTYFRSLPVPLLTFDLHDQFVSAVAIKDLALKQKSLLELVNQLPDEHYYTLRHLMLHLHRVRECCEKNLMTARNLGVVFGPTLMRSRDPGAEFSDMAGKALFIEWLIENAPQAFNENNLS